MSDLLGTRRERLLIDQWRGPSSLAKKLGLSGPSYLSQLAHGTRPINEKTARKFEKQLDLPPGWLDRSSVAQEENSQPVDASLVEHCVEKVGEVLAANSVSVNPAKFAKLVGLAYVEARRQGVVERSYIEQLLPLLR